ncbi:MAG: response regulator transcription factor [Clostridia bacterium]|nr:response regulator transcription factor [Clostridia bacterium]
MINNLKIAICDDDVEALLQIEGATAKVLQSCGIKTEIEIFDSMRKLERALEETVFDLFLLDIDMGGMDGIEFGQRLRAKKNKTEIIYVSNREDRVFESLEVRPFGFVRKSNFLKDMASVMRRFLQKAEQRKKDEAPIVVSSKGSLINVSVENLMYIEGAGKNQLFHLTNGDREIVVQDSLENLEEKTRERGFLRVHKGFLVNYRFISVIGRSDITLLNGETIPLSRKKGIEIREQYLRLAQKNGSLLL